MEWFDVMMDISDLKSMPEEITHPAFISSETREGRYFFLDLKPPQARPLWPVNLNLTDVCL